MSLRRLTRTLLGAETPPCPFPHFLICSKTEENRATKLSEPIPTSILHMLTKGQFHIYDVRSVVSDVRVASCYAILGER